MSPEAKVAWLWYLGWVAKKAKTGINVQILDWQKPNVGGAIRGCTTQIKAQEISTGEIKMYENTKIADIFVRAMSGSLQEELWNVELPAGTQVNANLDFHGTGRELTDRVMTVREAMDLARQISIPWNKIGSQWRRVITPYGVVYEEHYAQNGMRGHSLGFAPSQELLKYAAEQEVEQYKTGQRGITEMRQAIVKGEIFDSANNLVAWIEENQYHVLMLYRVSGGYMALKYLIWRDVKEVVPVGGYAILETKYSGMLKLSSQALEAYQIRK